MANVLVEENSLKAIADAIRVKNGSEKFYTPGEMAEAVAEINGSTGIWDKLRTFSIHSNPEGTGELVVNIPAFCQSLARSFASSYSQRHNYSPIILNKSDTDYPVTNMGSAFEYCYGTTEITINFDTSEVTSWSNCFYNCNVGKINGILDFSSCTSNSGLNGQYTFMSLKDFRVRAQTIHTSVQFKNANLTDEALQSVIKGLADLTNETAQNLILHASVKGKMTEEQIAAVTSKNWTLA